MPLYRRIQLTLLSALALVACGPSTPTPAIPKVVVVTITPPAASIALGGTAQLSSDVVVENSAATTVKWSSSDPGKATVSASGLVTGLAGGSATITATSTVDASKKAEAIITITQTTITGVSIDPTSAELEVGQNLALFASVSGTGSFDQSLSWSSSDSSKAVVGPDGVVTAIAAGNLIITAASVADSNKSAEVSLTVKAVPAVITGVVVEPNLINVKMGSNQQLSATVTGTGDFNPNVAWTSSDTSKATVDSTGLVQGLAMGSVSITATSVGDSTKKGTASITVDAVGSLITGVSVNLTNAILEVGQTLAIAATVTGNGNFDKSVSWSSSDTSKATVDSSGLVSAIATGSVNITATSVTDSSKKASSTLTINAIPAVVTGVSISPSSAVIGVGGTKVFSATVSGTGSFNLGLTWSSSNTIVATVNSNGLVTGVAGGLTTITATSVGDPSKKATATLQVATVLTFNNYTPLETTINRPLPAEGDAKIAGGIMPYSFTALNALPSGVSLNPTTGAIVGTPSNTGEGDFTIKVTDANGVSKQAVVHIKVNAAPFLSYTALKDLTQGKAIQLLQNYESSVSKGTPPYTYSIQSGDLPGGLSLNASTGAITGTPAKQNIYIFTATIKLTDASGATASNSLTLKTHGWPVHAITVNHDQTVGVDISGVAFVVSSYAEPVTYSTSGLPPGVSSPNAYPIGKPTTAGTFNVTSTLTDTNGASTTAQYTLKVNKAPTLGYIYSQNRPNNLPANTEIASPSLSGGTGPFTYTRTNIQVPNGPNFDNSYTFDVQTGKIRTKTSYQVPGYYKQGITVTEVNGAKASFVLSWQVYLAL